MWRDLENNVSNTSTTDYGRSGTSENNFGKYIQIQHDKPTGLQNEVLDNMAKDK